jgi:hypothetical protein
MIVARAKAGVPLNEFVNVFNYYWRTYYDCY